MQVHATKKLQQAGSAQPNSASKDVDQIHISGTDNNITVVNVHVHGGPSSSSSKGLSGAAKALSGDPLRNGLREAASGSSGFSAGTGNHLQFPENIHHNKAHNVKSQRTALTTAGGTGTGISGTSGTGTSGTSGHGNETHGTLNNSVLPLESMFLGLQNMDSRGKTMLFRVPCSQ